MAFDADPVPESGVTPARVVEAVADIMAGPLIYGGSDCCHAAADVFLRLWGIDLCAAWVAEIGTADVRSAGAALRLIGPRGFAVVASAVVARAGLVQRFEHPGALGLIRTETAARFGGVMAGICIRPGCWAGRTETGFGIATDAVTIWGIR
ncbi:DUF6950 family protein [Chachezhania sediminis]|uniref:DUF6950 family protein n=1 Tax=Chachezhania sediminis TaxID=2599291 RepID=UPI00131A70E0|nr:hypothetical protein [Chachezhania sediminis]